jgi:hypothetical protein
VLRKNRLTTHDDELVFDDRSRSPNHVLELVAPHVAARSSTAFTSN